MSTTTAGTATTTSAPHEPQPSGRSSRAAAARSEQLYALHHRMVAGLCRALLRDATEAEDAAQQVFLSAHRSLLNGAEPREPAAWLATIARNECWARISSRMREPLPSDASDDVVGSTDPVAEAIRSADLAALWRAIRALPKQQREALLLREFGGLRYDELAAALAVTEPAVESLLFRARTRLRAQLQGVAAALAPLARFLVGGGAPAIAAKAVTLGLGAAAVTGTAVVAPQVFEHPHHHGPPSARIVHDVAPVAVAQMPRVVRRVAESAPVTTTREAERHDGRGEREHRTTTARTTTTTTTASEHRGGGDRGEPTTTEQATTVELELSADGGSDGGSSSGSGGHDGPG